MHSQLRSRSNTPEKRYTKRFANKSAKCRQRRKWLKQLHQRLLMNK